MAEARLQSELADTKAEVQRLRDQIFRGTVSKDLSMVALIPKWSGSDKAIPLEEFFRSIEGTACIRNWSDQDCVQVAILKLTDIARIFYSCNVELHGDQVTWAKFKSVF
jgi:hypothetical protein